jgi:hypothetical protein
MAWPKLCGIANAGGVLHQQSKIGDPQIAVLTPPAL